MSGGWTWSVTFETAAIERGLAPTREAAEAMADVAMATLAAQGIDPDKLACHVAPVPGPA